MYFTILLAKFTTEEANIFGGTISDNQIIDLGFWPGGDRDGILLLLRKSHLMSLKNYVKLC